MASRLKIIRLCLGILFATFGVGGTEFTEAGPLYHEFKLTLAPGQRTEVLGPLLNFGQKETATGFAVPPLFSHVTDAQLDFTEFDVLYPLFTYDRFGQETRWQFFQLISLSGGQSQEQGAKERFMAFPFYFQQRAADSNLNYTAFLPFYGHLKGRLLRDEIHFVLFPLYSKTRKRDVVTDNYLYPFFHLRHGNGLRGWQLWPLVGREHKDITHRTDQWGDTELVGGHDKFFALWPFFARNTLGIGTTNELRQNVFLPFYSIQKSPARDSTSYLWPLVTVTDDREKKYREWDFPWPLVGFARGEGKHMNRVWPLFSQASNAVLRSDFYLWPLYKYNRAQAEPLDRERTRILFFLYSDVTEKNTLTGKEQRRTDLWPFFTAKKELDGNERLQVLSVLEPFIPNSKSIERNWSPLWSLWRAEKNAQTGARSQSLLWNLYRRDETPAVKKCSLLFGLFQYESTAERSAWRLFYLPAVKSKTPPAAPSNPGLDFQ
ncbi:MAG: hypothetical protein HZA89_06155 [Verrucomicrobia bacterium]|nr:hypothetical protein [Verrucomicrobiota bacterium]